MLRDGRPVPKEVPMPRSPALPTTWTVADLLEQLGDVSPRRIRLHPPPGQATEQDLVAIHDRENRLYGLVDGILVEKVVGYLKSALALWLAHLVQGFLDRHDLGLLTGPDGAVRLLPRLVRMPDIAFVSWERLPGRKLPAEPVPDLAPDLAVEVLSEGNTPKEMRRKLKDYFLAGVRQVWYVDPRARTVEVYTAPDERVLLTEDEILVGGDVLPGLDLPVREVFTRVPGPAGGRGKRKSTKRKGRDQRK
jgi:Uma2 family endonuclease